ncbi:conserved Plasmodium protein, unknown function [Plasmodium ovale curtisi]|uniref:Uncharacterized protein n=2 Tax=Plasmodium ovale TaxID=36330 RepID=A0A1A8W3E3_PLAOA|nr:conserved Plasmodium protein, unknown function [Plasmodium ovale curtisi]SBS92023.1 conserved Plasmodium protein, unknown function [Plasmodium ovale curtisi]
MMFNDNGEKNEEFVNTNGMPLLVDCNNPEDLHKEEKEDDTRGVKNMCNLLEEMQEEINVFPKIIENVNFYLNNLKKENKYYDFLFSNSPFFEKHDLSNDYIFFKKGIEMINSLDVIQLCLSFHFNNKSLFSTLLTSYNEINLIEANKIYHVLFELTNVLINGYDMYMDGSEISSEFLDTFILNYELKYISCEQINKIYRHINEDKGNYMIMLRALLDFCLNLIDIIHASVVNSPKEEVSYWEDVVIVKRDMYTSALRDRGDSDNCSGSNVENEDDSGHRDSSACSADDDNRNDKEASLVEENRLLINNVHYTEERRNKAYKEFFENCFSVEKASYGENDSGMLETNECKITKCIFVCSFEDSVVLVQNSSKKKGNTNVEDKERKKNEKKKFALQVKRRCINLNFLKIVMCTLLKAMKLSQCLNEDMYKRLSKIFSQMFSDILKSFYEKKGVIFLDIFFTDILKTTHAMVLYYNENIERTPKQTMLFYRCFNNIIDLICKFLHNEKLFYKIVHDKDVDITYMRIEKYLHSYDQTYYMLFRLFYALVEKTNRVNNDLFLFFCCVVFFEQGEKGKDHINNHDIAHVKSITANILCLNILFLKNCKEEVKEKNLNRIITIFLFLEKKVKRYFSFFKYVFCFLWEQIKRGNVGMSGTTMGEEDSTMRNFQREFQLLLKKIEYAILDMFVKYTKLLIMYRYYFSAKWADVGKEKVPFSDEFHLYINSLEKILFSIFPNTPNGIITKLEEYLIDTSKMCKPRFTERDEFFEFNKVLYNLDGKTNGWVNVLRGDPFLGDRKREGNNEAEEKANAGTFTPPKRYIDRVSDTNGICGDSFPHDMVILNILGIIYANIMENIADSNYKFVYYKTCVVHYEFMKKLQCVLINESKGTRGGSTNRNKSHSWSSVIEMVKEEDCTKGEEKKSHLGCYFRFPYVLLSSIIISQLKCFMNSTLSSYKICTVVIDFLFYISSSTNPFFFYTSKQVWQHLGHSMNKNEDALPFFALTNIVFCLISDKKKGLPVREDGWLLQNKTKGCSPGCTGGCSEGSSKEYLLYAFLKNQVIINDKGKNYLFFLRSFLRNIHSEEMVIQFMRSFFLKFHENLQYTLNILLKFLNAYERGVEREEKGAEPSSEGENMSQCTGNACNMLEGEEEDYKNMIEENRIISLFVYFDIVKMLPKRFLNCVTDLNLMNEIQNMFHFFIYANNEFGLLQKRYEKYRYRKLCQKINSTNGPCYYSRPKLYFPLVISSLISHCLFFVLKNATFTLQKRLIVQFYENFFSNNYLYTVCNNYVYTKVLSESLVVLLYLGGCKKGGNSNVENSKEEDKHTADDIVSEGIMCNGKTDAHLNTLSCLYKVYVIFLEEYAPIFLSSMVMLMKNNIVLPNESSCSHFYDDICADLKKDEKYSPPFKHLMLSMLTSFFDQKGATSTITYSSANGEEAENEKLVKQVRGNFLQTFFRNSFSSELLSMVYLKNEVSKFFQQNCKKYSLCKQDRDKLANLLLANLYDWAGV